MGRHCMVRALRLPLALTTIGCVFAAACGSPSGGAGPGAMPSGVGGSDGTDASAPRGAGGGSGARDGSAGARGEAGGDGAGGTGGGYLAADAAVGPDPGVTPDASPPDRSPAGDGGLPG